MAKKKKAKKAKKVAKKKSTARKKAAKKPTAKKTTKKAKKKTPKRTAAPARKKETAKKATKTTAKPKRKKKRALSPALSKPYQPSPELAAVVGNKPMPRSEVVSKLWEYIRGHKLQDTNNRQVINADDLLRPVFNGKKSVTMFEMNQLLSNHLK